jgi:hypothetical protein
MPALSADWEAVKTTAIALGSLKRAADEHGISYESVRMRASREGWPIGHRVQKQLRAAQSLAKAQIVQGGSPVTAVTSSAAVLASVGERTKAALAHSVLKGAEATKELDGHDVLASARNIKELAATGALLHGWSGDVQRVQVNVFASIQGSSEPVEHEEGPIIDV